MPRRSARAPRLPGWRCARKWPHPAARRAAPGRCRVRRNRPRRAGPLRVLRRVLRRWPKAAVTILPSRASSTGGALSATGRGTIRTMLDITLGAGRKAPAARRTGAHVVAVLQHHRQAAVLLGARLGHHAHDHLLLQHEGHVLDLLGVGRPDGTGSASRCCRRVADHPQRRAVGHQAAEVELEASPSWIVSLSGEWAVLRRAIRSRSISTTCRWSRRAIRGSVIAPRPGPISTMRSPGWGGSPR